MDMQTSYFDVDNFLTAHNLKKTPELLHAAKHYERAFYKVLNDNSPNFDKFYDDYLKALTNIKRLTSSIGQYRP